MKKPIPSPCLDTCNFRRRGYCTDCGLTRAQKRLFQGLKKADQRLAFLLMLREQQGKLGGYDNWVDAYAAKCIALGVVPPRLD